MEEISKEVAVLLDKLNTLIQRQNGFSKEIAELKAEIISLKESKTTASTISPELERAVEQKVETTVTTTATRLEPIISTPQEKKPPFFDTASQQNIRSNFEKFIGENLINKIGIAITVLGVAIGVQYSIEHQLISPLTRVILGYLVGIGLLLFGMKLKKEYANFSAVLVSGAMTILYFMTFAAYSFYALIPQLVCFGLMVAFTGFTVFASIQYNKQIIAIIGLVGAYAVPFLLSDGSGRVAVLFSYMAIINAGILFLAFKRDWKQLFYAAFGLTWLIFISWFSFEFSYQKHFQLALIFAVIFFGLFYAIFLGFKLIEKQAFHFKDIILLLANSFIFYGLGYAILDADKYTAQFLGIFTLLNAIIHFGVSALVYKKELGDRNLFYLVVALVMVFVTITVPVQLDGNWVTLVWAAEAAILFWIGRTKNVALFENLSYPLFFLAFFSFVQDQFFEYNAYYPDSPQSRISFLLNRHFFTAVFVMGAFGFINFTHFKNKQNPSLLPNTIVNSFLKMALPIGFLIVTYTAFASEISCYWDQLYTDSMVLKRNTVEQYDYNIYNYSLLNVKDLMLLNYSLVFFSILSFINLKRIKNEVLGVTNVGFNLLVLGVFLTQGLLLLSDLRTDYILKPDVDYFHYPSWYIGIRYVSFVLVGVLLYTLYLYRKENYILARTKQVAVAFDLILATTIIWIASSELITWMSIFKNVDTYKFGLSILWGVYALLLIAFGIWKKKKHLRLGAILLFSITLVKLFVYDISHLGTIAKTVVFVSLGVLLLVISFLYNKYKHLIADEN